MQLTAEGTWLRVRGEDEKDGRTEGAWRSRGNISNTSLAVESKSPTPAPCKGNCSVDQRAVEGVHDIVAVVLRHRYGITLDVLVPDNVGEDAVQRRDTHHAHLAFKHESCHAFKRNQNKKLH